LGKTKTKNRKNNAMNGHTFYMKQISQKAKKTLGGLKAEKKSQE